MAQTYRSLWIHLIWSTKNRNPLIHQKLKHPLYNKIRSIAQEKQYHLDCINGIADHVHLLISLNPRFSISVIVKDLKGISYHWVNENNLTEEHFAWQDGYGAFSVSPSNVQRVRQYIFNQERHHQEMSFADEIIKLQTTSMVH